MDTESDSEVVCTPPNISKAAADAISDLVPTKSELIYKQAYQKFMDWRSKNEIRNFSENVLLAYFSELALNSKWKCSTLWSHYSMVKSMLNIRNGVDISKYIKLRLFLKKKNEGYTPKKSRVFTKEEFDKFIQDAPNEKYLAMKVSIITYKCE